MELFRLFGTLGLNGVEETQSDINETTEQAENAEPKMSGAFKKIGQAVMTYLAVDKIIDFGRSVVDASATVSAEESAFEQIMGDYSDNAQKKMHEVAEATGVVDTRLTGYMTSMTAKFKGLGYGIDDATTLASDGLMLASDASAFWNKSLEDSVGALNSFINGSYEGGEAIGLFANDTQLASYAVKNGIVSEEKEWSNLDEARKQATRLEYAQEMYRMSGATGQASKEADQYANVQADLTEKWRQFKAQIGEPLLQNVVLPAMEKLSTVVDKASEGYEKAKKAVKDFTNYLQEHKTQLEAVKGAIVVATTAYAGFKAGQAIQSVIKGFQNAKLQIMLFTSSTQGASLAQASLNGVLTVGETIVALLTGKMTLAQLAQAGMTKAQTALNAVMSANPIGIIIALISALVVAFIYLWNNCEGFRQFWIDLWEKVKQKFNEFVTWINEKFNEFVVWFKTTWDNIKTTVSNTVESIKTKVSNAWNAIKTTTSNVFNSIKTTVSNIWNGIKSTISNVAEGVKTTVTNIWNGIKTTTSNVFNGIKSTATSVWNGIKSAITSPMETAKSFVKGIIDSIKGFFNFTISWPHIPLPHFSIKPRGWSVGDLLKGKIPSLGISWYAKGGIFDEPTIFPTAQGFKGVGEAGAEAVTPINVLLDYVKQAVREENAGTATYIQKLIDMLSDYMPQIVDGIDRPIVLDDGTLVSRTARLMDAELGEINKGRGRGR